MKAVVLVGGFGTRLRPLTYNCTKALLPIVNVPFLDRLVHKLENCGVRDILLAVGHRSSELEEHLAAQKDGFRARVTCSAEPEPLGSGGALKFNESFLDEPFLLLNGDILTDLDYGEAIRFHRDANALVTVCVARVKDPTRFGVIAMDERGEVACWQEKPSLAEARSNWVNIGVWAMSPEIVSRIPVGCFVSLEKTVFPALLEGGAPFFAYRSQAYWADIGTPESYARIHAEILHRNVREPIPGNPAGKAADVWFEDGDEWPAHVSFSGPISVGGGSRFGKHVSLTGPSAVGRACEFGDGTTLNESILCDEVVTAENVIIENSILGRGVRLGPGTRVTDSIIADHAVIEGPGLKGAKIGPGTHFSGNSLHGT